MGLLIDLADRDTLTDRVYRLIKLKIITSEFLPGARLKENHLAEMLGVSATPVREAIRRLSSEQLVESLPYRGAFVREMSPVIVEHIYEVRMALEELAVELACARMKQSDLRTMESILLEHEKAFSDNDVSLCLETDMRLHDALVQAAGNEVLLLMYRDLAVRIQALRQLDDNRTRRTESLQDHRALLEALAQGDVVRGKATVRAHVIRGKAHVLSLSQTVNREGKIDSRVHEGAGQEGNSDAMVSSS